MSLLAKYQFLLSAFSVYKYGYGHFGDASMPHKTICGIEQINEGEYAERSRCFYAQLQVYTTANGGAITYNPAAYPYFFGADGKGYATWTPRSVKAAFNYYATLVYPGQVIRR